MSGHNQRGKGDINRVYTQSDSGAAPGVKSDAYYCLVWNYFDYNQQTGK